MWPMVRVKFALSTVTLLAYSVIGTPMVRAQATVETGGVTGAASNVTTISPDFSGMASTLTGTAPESPDAAPSQSSTPEEFTAPEPQPAPDAPWSDEVP